MASGGGRQEPENSAGRSDMGGARIGDHGHRAGNQGAVPERRRSTAEHSVALTAHASPSFGAWVRAALACPLERVVEVLTGSFDERTGAHRVMDGQSVCQVACGVVAVAAGGGEETEEAFDGSLAHKRAVDEDDS